MGRAEMKSFLKTIFQFLEEKGLNMLSYWQRQSPARGNIGSGSPVAESYPETLWAEHALSHRCLHSRVLER